jgi:glycosyltransferase involved in cell wall biosynthesis
VIAGEGPDREALGRLSARLGLGERVTFVGHVRDIESWMGRASLVVQPSRFEGFPNAVLESMGMGAAVISANCPAGPAELIEDGVNGRLVPVEDVPALARAMSELMSDPALRARFGREATRVRERFGQETIMAQWEAVLVPG